jgi:dTDP-glucose pyrophosphorylase
MTDYLKKITLQADVTTSDVIKNLTDSGLQIVLLVDKNNKLIATVTDGDIRKGFANGHSLDDKIINVANLDPKTVYLNATTNVLKDLFDNFWYKAIPIINNNHQLIGCHLITDFLNLKTIEAPFLIMAGGFGKRLGKLTRKCPKPMIKFDDKPILQHIIEKASKDGFRNIYISTHFLGHIIEKFFGDGKQLNVNISYLREPHPLGTAGCLKLMPNVNSPIVVSNGDLISKIGYKTILDYHCSVAASATMAVTEHKMFHPFGVVKSEGIDLIEFQEKPIWKTNINAGIYVLDKSAPNLIKTNENVSMPEIFTRFQKRKERTVIFPVHEKWIDVGTPKVVDILNKENTDFL